MAMAINTGLYIFICCRQHCFLRLGFLQTTCFSTPSLFVLLLRVRFAGLHISELFLLILSAKAHSSYANNILLHDYKVCNVIPHDIFMHTSAAPHPEPAVRRICIPLSEEAAYRQVGSFQLYISCSYLQFLSDSFENFSNRFCFSIESLPVSFFHHCIKCLTVHFIDSEWFSWYGK